MKNIKFALMLIAMLIAILGNATVWHVNNNVGVDTDFTSLQQAHDDAGVINGDTLYVYGSSSSYGSLTMTKQLTLIGTGYFLGENPETQANTLDAKTYDITMLSGSENSMISGIYILHNISIQTSYQTILRNRIDGGLVVGNSASLINIQNNYFSTSQSMAINIESGTHNVLIINNLILNYNVNNHVYYTLSTTSNNIFNNNVISGKIRCYNTDLKNNIQTLGNFYDENSSNTYFNNISHTDDFGTENGNQANVNMGTVFVGTGSTDSQWQLAEGSPAIGAGYSGEDCGVFGGNTPYKLSGLPAIPAIYFFSAPAVGYELPIEVKAKSHN